MKKPDLYTPDKYERRPSRGGRSAIWNSLYYTRNGRRRKYIDKKRWQFIYDQVKPWTAYCVHSPSAEDKARHIIYVAHQESFMTFKQAVDWLNNYKHHDYELEKIVNG